MRHKVAVVRNEDKSKVGSISKGFVILSLKDPPFPFRGEEHLEFVSPSSPLLRGFFFPLLFISNAQKKQVL